MAQLLSWLGQKAKGGLQTVNRDIVAPTSHAIGNTVNAGATAARDAGGAAQATAKSTAHQFGVALPKSVYDIGRGAAASATGNKVALQHANQAKQKDQGEFIQPFTRPFVQMARTVEHPFTPNSYQAKGRDAQTIFGKAPVQNIAAGVQSNYRQHPNLPMPKRIGLATAYGVGQVAQDAGTLAGARQGAKVISKEVGKTAPVVKGVATKTAAGAKVANEKAFTPRANLEDQYTLKDFSDYKAGAYQPRPGELNPLLAKAREIGQKHGIDLVNGTPAQHIDRANAILDQIGKKNREVSQGGYVKIGRGDGAASSSDAGKVPKQIASTPSKGLLSPASKNSVASKSKAAVPPAEPPVATAGAAIPPMKPPAHSLATMPEVPPNPNLPGQLGKQRQSNFSGKTVPGSEYVSKGVKEKLDAPNYTVQQEKENYTASLGKLKGQGQDQFITNSHEALNKSPGTISRQEATDAITAAQLLDNANDPASLARASDIYDRLSEHYTAAGQLTQSAAILSRRTPQGLLYDSFRQLKRSGAQVTPELQAQIKNAVDDFKRAPKGQKDYAAAKVKKLVADNVPQNALDKLTSVWKAGLLSGVKTQQGNALSNATFAGLKKVSDIPATAVDKGISLFTGKRTKTLTARGSLQGAKEGVVNAKGTLRTGLDRRNITEGKYQQHGELNFKNPVINTVFGKPTNLVFRGTSAADQPFYYSAAKNSLYDQAIALAKTNKLTGAERTSFVENAVKNPSKGMAETARAEADKSVLGYDTAGSKIIQGGLRAVDNSGWSPAGKSFVKQAVNILAPFVKVPSAFISRTIDFTPAGPFKEAIRQISNKQFDQRGLSQAIGEGLTGTGAIALGVALSQHGLISGDYPKNDPKEAQRWKAEGITPNSIRLGGKWYSLNYMGPLGLLLNAGHQVQLTGSQGTATTVGAAAGGLGQGLLGQSFLQGLSGFSDAITNPAQNARNYLNSQVSSLVPSWVNDIANATDKSQRQADTVPEAIKNRVPRLRETNKVKEDVYGNQLSQPSGQLNTLNGTKPSDSLTNRNSAIAEVNRLHNVDPNNPDLQVTPVPPKKTVTVEKQTIPLTNDQRYKLQESIGRATQDDWSKLITTPGYQALDDIDKAKALSSLRTDAATLATRQFVLNNNLGTYTKSPSKRVQALGEGNSNLRDYTTPPKQSVSKSSPATKRLGTKRVSAKSNKSTKARRPSASFSAALKTASAIKAPTIPKVKIHKPGAFKSPTAKKLSVRRTPTNFTKRKLA